nr:MAG TPA: hypothetical protein [Bacteriophage sp.]
MFKFINKCVEQFCSFCNYRFYITNCGRCIGRCRSWL